MRLGLNALIGMIVNILIYFIHLCDKIRFKCYRISKHVCVAHQQIEFLKFLTALLMLSLLYSLKLEEGLSGKLTIFKA